MAGYGRSGNSGRGSILGAQKGVGAKGKGGMKMMNRAGGKPGGWVGPRLVKKKKEGSLTTGAPKRKSSKPNHPLVKKKEIGAPHKLKKR